MAAMSKIERLLRLVAMLVDAPYPLPLFRIFDEMPPDAYPASNPASKRKMFELDKAALRDRRINVETVRSLEFDGEAYIIDQKAMGADLPAFDRDESAAIALVLSAMDSDIRLWEVGGDASAAPGDSPISSAGIGDDEDVRALLGAVAESGTVAFDYLDTRSGAVRGRTVQPHLMAYTKGHWHLSGHDLGRDGGRQFRADRIEVGSVVRTGDRFEPPERPHPIRADHFWRTGTDDPVDVELLVEARHAAWVERFLGSGAVTERRDDGSVVVAEAVRNFAAFRGFVLTLLDGAEVLGPPEVRAEMAGWLTALADQGGGA